MKGSVKFFLAFLVVGPKTFGQGFAFNRPQSREEKIAMLEDLSHTHILWLPLDSTTHQVDRLAIVVPDTVAISGQTKVANLVAGFAAIYTLLVYSDSHLHVDTLYSSAYKESDTTKVIYSGVTVNPARLIRKVRLESLIEFFVSILPHEGRLGLAADELIIRLNYKNTWDEPSREFIIDGYSSDLFGVLGKYILKETDHIKRILIIWKDNKGKLIPLTVFPFTKEFKRAYKNF